MPWSRWRLSAEIQGAGGIGPHGFLAHAPQGDTIGAIDIIMESDLPVADFNAALAGWAETLTAAGSHSHNSAQAHYEQGGRWHGTLLRQRRGSGGHGYDPVFLDPAHGQTAAEMPMDLKNRISHRGRAMALLRERLIGSR